MRGGVGAAASLKIEDVEAIRKEVPDVQYIAPGVNLRAQVIAGNQNWSTRLEGTDVDFPLIRQWPVKYGAFFSPQDVSSARRVAVLGKTVSEQLFGPDVDPTGQMIRIRNQPFKVIGVMDTKGQAAMGNDQDDTIFAPYTTVQKRLQGQQNIQNITISAASADAVTDVADAVAVVMRKQHKLIAGEPDDFTIRTQEEIADIRTASIETMTKLLAGIAGVSLIVGGIGIMNIMLVSVTERTREIGIRLAIGAKGRDVLLQFLVEAIVISLLGGGIGIALGFGMAELATRVWQFPTAVPPNAVAMAFGFSADDRNFLRLLSGAKGRGAGSDRRACATSNAIELRQILDSVQPLSPVDRDRSSRARSLPADAARTRARGSAGEEPAGRPPRSIASPYRIRSRSSVRGAIG